MVSGLLPGATAYIALPEIHQIRLLAQSSIFLYEQRAILIRSIHPQSFSVCQGQPRNKKLHLRRCSSFF